MIHCKFRFFLHVQKVDVTSTVCDIKNCVLREEVVNYKHNKQSQLAEQQYCKHVQKCCPHYLAVIAILSCLKLNTKDESVCDVSSIYNVTRNMVTI